MPNPNKKRSRDSYECMVTATTLSSNNSTSKKKKIKVLKNCTLVLTILLSTISSYYTFSLIMSWIQRSQELSAARSEVATNRVEKTRTTWKEENRRISDWMFYQLFRMHCRCFNDLCYKIEKLLELKISSLKSTLGNWKKWGVP